MNPMFLDRLLIFVSETPSNTSLAPARRETPWRISKKARWYLDREIANLEQSGGNVERAA
jgi:hypothetical protein